MSSEPAPLAVRDAVLGGQAVGLRCERGVIAELGPGVKPRSGEETLDAAGAPPVAPLINGHTHPAMTLFRGDGGDLALMRWLWQRVWPLEARLEPEDVYWGTRLACLEMIRTGTIWAWRLAIRIAALLLATTPLPALISTPSLPGGSDPRHRPQPLRGPRLGG